MQNPVEILIGIVLRLCYFGDSLHLFDSVSLHLTLYVFHYSLSHVLLFATPWTVAHQAPLSVGFSRQEYWSGLPFPPPGDLYFTYLFGRYFH